MKTLFHSKEKGQSIVLITLMFIAFVAMLALVLDGGLAFASRRKAQNAADAGALAGAAKLCATKDVDIAKAVAESYAIDNNNATTAVATVDNTLKTVTVDATVDYQTTFAFIFDINTGTAAATAKAQCSPVCGGTGVMPVLWTCKDPWVEGSDSVNCAMKFGPENPYIIMDTGTYEEDTLCESEGGFTDCDINDDGIEDMIANSGSRSWLNLCGYNSFCDCTIDSIIRGTCDMPLVTKHMWFSDKTGVSNDFALTETYLEGEIVLIPVYDNFCVADQEKDTDCPVKLHDEDVFLTDESEGPAWHIHEFAAFKITCVKSSTHDLCPAMTEFIEQNCYLFKPYTSPDKTVNLCEGSLGDESVNSYFTIEGYFMNEYSPETVACNPGAPLDDVGNYTVTLLP